MRYTQQSTKSLNDLFIENILLDSNAKYLLFPTKSLNLDLLPYYLTLF